MFKMDIGTFFGKNYLVALISTWCPTVSGSMIPSLKTLTTEKLHF